MKHFDEIHSEMIRLQLAAKNIKKDIKNIKIDEIEVSCLPQMLNYLSGLNTKIILLKWVLNIK